MTARLKAWRRWREAAGPWRGWAVCPVLSMPAEPLRASSSSRPGLDLAALLAKSGTALVLDVEPALGVRAAAEASRLGLAHVVLVLPRWPHADAMLPAGELLRTLVTTSIDVQASSTDNVVFVLDGERQMAVQRPADDSRIDNRYALPPSELPDLATLRSAGIQRVVKISHAR